jgi:hypothetical protein
MPEYPNTYLFAIPVIRKGKDQNSHPKKGMRRRQIRKSGEKRMKMKEKDTVRDRGEI